MKKSLLILVSHLSFFISHRLEIAIAAKQKGYDVKVAVGELDADVKYLNKIGIDYFHVPIDRGGTNIYKDLKSIFLIWKLFKKINPKIIHLVTIKPYLYGGIIARLTKVPCVVSAVSGLGSLFIHKNISSTLYRFFLFPLYKIAFNHHNQCVIFQNNSDAKLLLNWGVLNKKKIQIIKGSGVNIKKFTKLKETNKIPTISLVSRLLSDKGVHEFVSAADILHRRNISAKFLIAGGLDLKNPTGLTINDLKKLKKNRNIKFLGHRKNISLLYANSHIICLPSYREGFPKSLIEAAAASRAVITTNVPGCRDSIIPNKTGLLVPVKNANKLANAIQFLIENPKIRKSMGKAGRKLAKNQYQIKLVINTHIKIYERLLNKLS
jgi:glycosyltransferase involved in cell wall biosynthesis